MHHATTLKMRNLSRIFAWCKVRDDEDDARKDGTGSRKLVNAFMQCLLLKKKIKHLMYVCVCVCVCMCARARACARSFYLDSVFIDCLI